MLENGKNFIVISLSYRDCYIVFYYLVVKSFNSDNNKPFEYVISLQSKMPDVQTTITKSLHPIIPIQKKEFNPHYININDSDINCH